MLRMEPRALIVVGRCSFIELYTWLTYRHLLLQWPIPLLITDSRDIATKLSTMKWITKLIGVGTAEVQAFSTPGGGHRLIWSTVPVIVSNILTYSISRYFLQRNFLYSHRWHVWWYLSHYGIKTKTWISYNYPSKRIVIKIMWCIHNAAV